MGLNIVTDTEFNLFARCVQMDLYMLISLIYRACNNN